jgi:GAF domain-containing protein
LATVGTRAADSDAMKNRRRTTTKTKRRSAPKVSGRRKPSSTSTNANTKNALLERERDELLEQQKATAEVLRIISASPGELKPVFDAILENATRICEAKFGVLFLAEDDGFRIVALHGAPPAYAKARLGVFTREKPGTAIGRVAATKQPAQIADIWAERDYTSDPERLAILKLAGARTNMGVPMLKDNKLVGVINIFRQEVRPFTDKQIELVQNFAAQAVIAIENTRLLSELRQRTDDLTESLEQQTATSEVLSVISSSPGDLEPVFQAMLENAARVCDAKFGNIYRWDGDALYHVAAHNAPPALVEARKLSPRRPDPNDPLGRMLATKTLIHVADLAAEDAYIAKRAGGIVEAVELGGMRSLLLVPMLKENELIGAFGLARHEVRPFTDKQIALVQNFAAQAVIAIENTRLLNELRQSLEQQTATAEVLSVISSSPGDLKPVFDAMLENAVRICDAKFGFMNRYDGDTWKIAAVHGAALAYTEYLQQRGYQRPGPETVVARIVSTKQIVHIADLAASRGYAERDPVVVAAVELGGVRTLLGVPMLKEDELIGAILLYRQEVRPFTDKQIELVQNFAAQAVIAIENTRLLNELRKRTDDLTESLEQQTATSEVLRVVSASPGDMKPVFEAMLSNALRICEAKFGHILLYDGERYHASHLHDVPPSYREFWEQNGPIRPGPNTGLARLARTKQVAHIPDLKADSAYAKEREPLRVVTVDHAAARTFLAVPMLKEDQLIGAIVIYRQEVRPFTEKQIELVRNFAAQAVIAIENTRLLNELRQSLEQQTATADVLRVISSSPGDLEPVFQAMLENATRICEAKFGTLFRFDGQIYHLAAQFGTPPEFAELQRRRGPFQTEPGTQLDLARRTKRVSHTADYAAEAVPGNAAKLGGARSTITVPMLKDDEFVGAFSIYRQEVRPFSDKQIELVQNFAAQAVIAIENTRLLNELRESLQQQTATADVLKVISSSPGELEPVFQAMLENATRICEANFGILFRLDDGVVHVGATLGVPLALAEFMQNVRKPGPHTATARAMRTGQVIHILDVREEKGYREGDPMLVFGADKVGLRTLVAAPMLKDKVPIGSIGIYRTEVRPFTDKQIELLRNFAAQAVIAIENTRLLNELRQRTDDLTESLEQQTATSDVLKVISGSPGNLEPVFQAMLENAVRICDAKFGMLFRYNNEAFEPVALFGLPPALDEFLRQQRGSFQPIPGSLLDRIRQTKQLSHTADYAAEAAPSRAVTLGGARSTVDVPMLKDGELIGVISIYRQEVRPFTDKQIELVQNFAAQAVIAIENTRLLNELRQRTDDLSKSLDDLRTAQDRLVQTQKLASLGQLTAGIAHEIKNPLNFVNNFSGVSVELIDELQDALRDAPLTEKAREEINELSDTLRDNLGKIVQHGKRADSIVKNMLLHSREGSGERRSVDVNALVEESLNLAYHGARAETQGFNVTLERSFDPTAGEVDVFPQEITRVLLNLISNGFYAATKRQGQESSNGFEPTITAATKSLGDRVEIRIRDNGTGIPPEVREKMFNPFFTTKPAGEGTGLGLSISHDIIVKQHSGSIEVDTEPGQFTEFRITLPRSAG